MAISMRKKLSICIPTYNRANYLVQALDSILKQSPSDIEIIISDNASTDDTELIISDYLLKYKQIKYFRHANNVGADQNYLKVIELANSDYCWLLGSDDLINHGAMVRVLNEIKSKADVYMCGLISCDLDMRAMYTHKIFKSNQDFVFNLSNPEQRAFFFNLALTTTALFSYISSLIINKKKWDDVDVDLNFFIGSLWVHVGKILGMIPNGLVVTYINEPLILKREYNDSFMSEGIVKRYKISIFGYRRIMNKFFGVHSFEAYSIRRVLRNEITLRHLLNAKFDCIKSKNREDLILLKKLVQIHYSDKSISNFALKFLFFYFPYSLFFSFKFFMKIFRRVETCLG
jgi:abequosyltransferase